MSAQPKVSSREVQDWLVAWVARETRVPPGQVDVQEPFVNLGLTSRQAVLLSGELEDWLGGQLPPTLAWEFPTIEQLARHLAEQQ